jgi:hypothetical protein
MTSRAATFVRVSRLRQNLTVPNYATLSGVGSRQRRSKDGNCNAAYNVVISALSADTGGETSDTGTTNDAVMTALSADTGGETSDTGTTNDAVMSALLADTGGETSDTGTTNDVVMTALSVDAGSETTVTGVMISTLPTFAGGETSNT